MLCSSPIPALCRIDGLVRAITVTRLSPEGCTAEAEGGWTEDHEFLRLTLAGQADVNGRVLRRDGARAEIRFFGQISPLVIESWLKRAA